MPQSTASIHGLEPDATANGILITDPEARIRSANSEFFAGTGYRPEEVIGRAPHFLCAERQGRHLYDAAWRQALHTGLWDGMVCNQSKSGEAHTVRLTVAAMHDGCGGIAGYVWTFAGADGPVKQCAWPRCLLCRDAPKPYRQREPIERLAQALQNREFILHYQPKVCLVDGAVIGVEALIRWQHPENGLIAPMDFLPLLDGTELATRIDEWVIEHAALQWAEWRAQGLDLEIAVNVAGHHLQQPGFLATVRRSLAAAAMPADRLEIELVETAALENLEAVSAAMRAGMDLGIGFALDDFGTGYSSLTHLRHLPVDSLKIDRSFVRGMLADPEDMAIVSSVLGLARAFGRRAVAEGVETQAHLERLHQMGCADAQGYAISPPLPADQLRAWLAARAVMPA
ncbi:MAG: EAL domain-containing protein [Azospira sp.]